MEKGTTNGAITDINGNFSIEVVTGAVLQISYIGYNTQDIKITDKTSYNIVLKEDVEALDEIVVVGYGTMRKRDLTGAVSQLKGDEIADLPLRSASDALQERLQVLRLHLHQVLQVLWGLFVFVGLVLLMIMILFMLLMGYLKLILAG